MKNQDTNQKMSRRNFVSTSAGGLYLIAAPAPSLAEPGGHASIQNTLPGKSAETKVKAGGHMQDSQQSKPWSDFKRYLQKQSPWLDAFTDSAVAQAINLIKPNLGNPYEPLLLETMLKEASEALDRCLALRREAYELEIAAVKAAADYQLFLLLTGFDKELETNALGIKRLHAEQDGYQKSSSLYTEKGFPEHDQTLSSSAQADLDAAEDRQTMLNGRWEVREKYEADYNSRHTAPGNAHNFKERMERTIALLADDLQEAYEKLLAVHTGGLTIYNKDFEDYVLKYHPFPKLDGEGALDDLVMWARAAIRFLDIEKQQEVSYDLVIPLTQKLQPSQDPILSYAALRKSIDSPDPQKIISFELGDVFGNQERVRLRGVGLAFGSDPAGDAYGSTEFLGYYRLRTIIHTPKQPKVTEPGSYYERPPVVLGNVSLHSHAVPVAMSSGPECRNLDPRGKWTIALNRLAVFCNQQEMGIEHDPNSEFYLVKDLKLHLSVVAKPSTDKGLTFTS
jgi:hypothetical protein